VTSENRRVHVEAEFARGRAALRAAETLLAAGLLNDAVSRAYYAALHHALALLLTEGIEPRTHAGTSQMLSLHFVMTGKLSPDRAKDLSRLEQFRCEADYNRFFVFTEPSAAEEVQVARRFCASVSELLESGALPPYPAPAGS
jgi:uncharacterized protein (UPF0332 family)